MLEPAVEPRQGRLADYDPHSALVYHSATPVLVHLLHDTLTCALTAADTAFNLLLLYYYYTHSARVYFISGLTLLSLASVVLSIHGLIRLYKVNSPRCCTMLLSLPLALLLPHVITLSHWTLPMRLLAAVSRISWPHGRWPTSNDTVKAYIIAACHTQSGHHLYSWIAVLPLTLLHVIYCMTDNHTISWINIAALMTSLLCIITRLYPFAFSVSWWSMLMFVCCLSYDVVNIVTTLLYLTRTTPAQPHDYTTFWVPNYSHSTIANALVLTIQMTMVLVLSFVLLLYGLSLVMRSISEIRHRGVNNGVRKYLALLCSWMLTGITAFFFFVPVVLLLSCVQLTWIATLLFLLGAHSNKVRHARFFRRLYATLNLSSNFNRSLTDVQPLSREEIYATINHTIAAKVLLYCPPPVCMTDERRLVVNYAKSITDQPVEAVTTASIVELKKSLKCDYQSLIKEVVTSLFVLLTGSHLYQNNNAKPLWFRTYRAAGLLACFVLLPVWVLGNVYRTVHPLLSMIFALAYDRVTVTHNLEYLLPLICAFINAVLLLLVLVSLPGVYRFHRAFYYLLMYGLTETLTPTDRERRYIGIDNENDNGSDSQPIIALDAFAHTQWKPDYDSIDDWPFEAQSLLYSKRFRYQSLTVMEECNILPIDGIRQMVVDYLPHCERLQTGREAENVEWIERSLKEQWKAEIRAKRNGVVPVVIEPLDDVDVGMMPTAVIPGQCHWAFLTSTGSGDSSDDVDEEQKAAEISIVIRNSSKPFDDSEADDAKEERAIAATTPSVPLMIVSEERNDGELVEGQQLTVVIQHDDPLRCTPLASPANFPSD